MNDKEYRRRAMLETDYTSHNALILQHRGFNYHEKQKVWLRALGLLETWDIL